MEWNSNGNKWTDKWIDTLIEFNQSIGLACPFSKKAKEDLHRCVESINIIFNEEYYNETKD